MSTIAFDTLKFSKKLVAVGFTEQQAETLAEEQSALIDDQLATKRDIADVKRDIADVRRDIADVRRDMKEMELRLRQDLTIRMGSMMVVAVGVVAALVKLL